MGSGSGRASGASDVDKRRTVDDLTPPQSLEGDMVFGVAHIRPDGLAEAIGGGDGSPTGSEIDSDEDGFRHGTYSCWL